MSLVAQPISKKSWIPPKVVLLSLSSTFNNSSGGGDGDSASAIS
jgi:hypothetical protein